MKLKLNFLGIGSGFNVALGNTSAFFKDKYENFYLIDCGFDVFPKLINYKLLDGVNNITVFLTHLHDDHSGSLATLMFYSYYVLHKKITIIFPTYDIMRLISLQGKLRQVNFNIYKENTIYEDKKKILEYQFIPTRHVDGMHCFSLRIKNMMDKDTDVIYYSGDSRILFKDAINTLELQFNPDIKIYQDVTHLKSFDEAVHMDLETLMKLVPIEIRSNINCVHLGDVSPEDVRVQGFNVPEIYKLED